MPAGERAPTGYPYQEGATALLLVIAGPFVYVGVLRTLVRPFCTHRLKIRVLRRLARSYKRALGHLRAVRLEARRKRAMHFLLCVAFLATSAPGAQRATAALHEQRSAAHKAPRGEARPGRLLDVLLRLLPASPFQAVARGALLRSLSWASRPIAIEVHRSPPY